MATRATIKVEGINYAKVYKHWDGYPKSTLNWLEDFNRRFVENRGDDPEYKFAQLLRSSIRDANNYSLGDSEFTGWGILNSTQNAGADYEYNLLRNGAVEYKKL